MDNVVLLKIDVYGDIIEIPFLDLETVDLFTVRYKNQDDLVVALNEMLGLSIKPKDVKVVYIYHEYVSRKNLHKSRNDVVKYSCDNFDMKTLPDAYFSYLNQDHNRIFKSGVYDISSKAMTEFKYHNVPLTEFGLKDAIRKYFVNAPYRTYRKVYYKIKGFVSVNKNKVERENDELLERNLSKFSSNDEYVQYLLRYAMESDENYSNVMEELSKIESDDLKKILNNPHFGLFDGVNNEKKYSLEDLYDLQKYTGMDIDDLMEVVSKKRKKGSRR